MFSVCVCSLTCRGAQCDKQRILTPTEVEVALLVVNNVDIFCLSMMLKLLWMAEMCIYEHFFQGSFQSKTGKAMQSVEIFDSRGNIKQVREEGKWAIAKILSSMPVHNKNCKDEWRFYTWQSHLVLAPNCEKPRCWWLCWFDEENLLGSAKVLLMSVTHLSCMHKFWGGTCKQQLTRFVWICPALLSSPVIVMNHVKTKYWLRSKYILRGIPYSHKYLCTI